MSKIVKGKVEVTFVVILLFISAMSVGYHVGKFAAKLKRRIVGGRLI